MAFMYLYIQDNYVRIARSDLIQVENLYKFNYAFDK